MDPLTRRWRTDCADAAPRAAPELVESLGADLISRWREPHRHYHDARHLTEVLAAVDTLCGRSRFRDAPARTVALMAAWFHDAVYDPTPDAANEHASADLARVLLAPLGLQEQTLDHVCTVILDTVDHDLGSEADGARVVFHDADLWVLSAPVARFDEYCEQVRAEFAHVAAPDYAAARTSVLRPFLVRPHIYRTKRARRSWEPAARENLARELTRLAG